MYKVLIADDNKQIVSILSEYCKKNNFTVSTVFDGEAALKEIEENEYNLNIPRYVDTFEEEEEIDIYEVNQLLAKDDEEIAALEKEISEQLALLGIKM